MQILLISSDPSWSRRIEASLNEKAYDVSVMPDDGDLPDRKACELPGIFIIDNRESKAEILDLCRRLREETSIRYIYIIMIVDREKGARMDGFDAGADSFINYPVDMDELDALIKVGRRVVMSVCRDREVLQNARPPQTSAKAVSGFEDSEKKNRLPGLGKQDQLSAKIALVNKLVTKEQLYEVISEIQVNKDTGDRYSLAEALHKKGMITSGMMKNLIAATKRRVGKRFGDIAVEKGFASRQDVDHALQIQAEEFKKSHSCRRIGDILVALGTITEQERDLIWLEQKDIELV